MVHEDQLERKLESPKKNETPQARYRKRHREQYNEYMRKWFQENPDKVVAIKFRYYQKKLEQLQSEQATPTE